VIENNDALGVSFELPDIYTGRYRMAFEARKGFTPVTEDDYLPRLWHAGFGIIKNWKCETVPADLPPDDVMTAAQMKVVLWTVSRVGAYVREADEIPKNS
jgi:hypothetical protein